MTITQEWQLVLLLLTLCAAGLVYAIISVGPDMIINYIRGILKKK